MAGADVGPPRRAPRRQSMLSVLHAIARRSPITQHELAAETGLSRSTVALVLTRLSEDRLIELVAPTMAEHTAEGRSMLPRLLNTAAPAICVDLGARHVAVGIGGPRGLLVEPVITDMATDATPLELLNLATEQVNQLLERQLPDLLERQPSAPPERQLRDRIPEQLVGVCLSVAAPLDQIRGQVTPKSGMDAWIGLRPAHELKRRLGTRWSRVPFIIENNTNLDALAATTQHSRKVNVCQDAMLLVRWGRGIGGAAVIDKQLVVGARGIATEIGHTPLYRHPKDGAPCARCGHHCLDSRASGKALTAKLARETGIEISFDALIVRAIERDELERALLRTAATEIGEVIGAYVSFLNPNLVVISGYHFGGPSGQVDAYPLIADPLRIGIRATAFPPTLEDFEVSFGGQTRAATLEGGVVAVLQRHLTPYFARLLAA